MILHNIPQITYDCAIHDKTVNFIIYGDDCMGQENSDQDMKNICSNFTATKFLEI